MNGKDLFTTAHIRTPHIYFTVKPARTQQCRIKNVHTVRCCDNDDSLIDTKTIHLYEHLV